MRADTEWGAYYDELVEEFALSIDTVGPAFGTEVLLEEIAESAERRPREWNRGADLGAEVGSGRGCRIATPGEPLCLPITGADDPAPARA